MVARRPRNLLNGKQYFSFQPPGQHIGSEPQFKWKKPSVVLMSEGNYSDAHMFPYTYQTLGIGKLIGAPVPGTGTAVWWETSQSGVRIGVPQVGIIDTKGQYLENTQLEPDIKVLNPPNEVIKGEDAQLKTAVEELMKN